MSLRGALWASTFAFLLLMLLFFLRLFNLLGSEYEILIRWVSAVCLILLGIFIGILVSEKKIQIRPMITPFIFFALGFFMAPFVAVGISMLLSNFPFSRGIEPLIVGGSVIGYLSLYMLFWFWFNKKKGIFKAGEAD